MVDDRRKNGSDRGNNRDRREIVPLRIVEEIISYDTLDTIKHLEDLTEAGDCLGIAFGAILRGGQIVQGYTGATIEQPTLAVGMLSRIASKIDRDAENGW